MVIFYSHEELIIADSYTEASGWLMYSSSTIVFRVDLNLNYLNLISMNYTCFHSIEESNKCVYFCVINCFSNFFFIFF